jgi:hypothetical protein
MRSLFIYFLLFASTAVAQSVRFTGSSIGDVGGSITFEGEYASDITLPLYHPTWDFDITTDGQSVTIHDMTISYHNDSLYINPLVWLELTVEAKIEDVTVDVNPSTTTVWTVQAHSFNDMSVSGVYHGIGLTQAFSGSLPDWSPSNSEQGLLDFGSWPDGLAWEAFADLELSVESRKFSASSSDGWIGVEPYLHIREILVYEPVSVLLSPVVESADPLLGDVNGDGDVNGLDVDPFVDVLLSGPYQQEADMNEDQVVNGLDVDPFVAAVVGGTQPIPEPSTLLLALVALGVVGGWRQWAA